MRNPKQMTNTELRQEYNRIRGGFVLLEKEAIELLLDLHDEIKRRKLPLT